MTVRSLLIVCVSCFFCSWSIAASHEEKNQGRSGTADSTNTRLPHEEEPQKGHVSRTSLGAVQDDDEVYRSTTLRRSSIPLDVLDPLLLETAKTSKGIRLTVRGRDAGDQSFDFYKTFANVTHLVLEGTAITDVVVPFTAAIGQASNLQSVEIRSSDTKDSFLFFLGSALREHKGISQIVLDSNRMTPIGLKSILLGLCPMENLRHLSWRFMPIENEILPFDDAYVQERRGYQSFKDNEVKVQMPDDVKVYMVTPDGKSPVQVFRDTILRPYDREEPLLDLARDMDWEGESQKATAELLYYLKRIQSELQKRGRSIVEEGSDEISVRFKHDPDIYRITFKDNRVVVSTAKMSIYNITFYRKSAWRFFFEDLLPRHTHLKTLDVTGSLRVSGEEGRKDLFDFLDTLEKMHHLETLGLGHVSFDSFAVRRLGKVLGNLAQQQSLNGETLEGKALKVLYLPGILPKGFKELADLKKTLKILTLEELDLAENHLGLNGLAFLGELLPDLRALRKLRVGKNNLFEGSDSPTRAVELFGAALKSRSERLEVLDLSENYMELRDLSHIKQGLLMCKNLQVLDLQGNRLTPQALRILKELVEELPNLKAIHIGGQSIQKSDLEKLTPKEQAVFRL